MDRTVSMVWAREIGLNFEFIFFLPASGNEMSVSPGRRFMIDLLVSSLMADGGLESALNAAITAEIQVSAKCMSHHFTLISYAT